MTIKDGCTNNAVYVGIDIGSTMLKACLFNASFSLIDYREEPIEVINDPANELCEIDPGLLWQQFHTIVLSLIEGVADVSKVVSVGISTQRNTFISWDSKTLIPCHRLVSWKDGRGKTLCTSWNKSVALKTLNFFGAILYFLTGLQRFKAAKILRFANVMVTHRFISTLNRNPHMQKLLANKQLAVGCLDTWLLAKLSNGRLFVTEPSNASASGMFDPFLGTWNKIILRLIGFPSNILLPKIIGTTEINTVLDENIFNGIPLKIGAILGDAQSAVFGCGGIIENTLTISLGSGTFMDYVVNKPIASVISGIYPIIGWRINKKSTFIMEGHSSSTASIINWMQYAEIIENIESLSSVIESTTPDQNLLFIPAFDGLQTPINNESACAAFLGLKATTTREQILRAMCESIAFNVAYIFETFKSEIPSFDCQLIRCCGGVSNNDFICQQMANLLNMPIERIAEKRFCAAKGAAFMAAIASANLSYDDVTNYVTVEYHFTPIVGELRDNLWRRYQLWKNSLKRCLNYYV